MSGTDSLGLTRITFSPYTFQELEEIVRSRLQGIDAFGGDSVELCARKVSHGSGDARKVLEICRRAIEILQRRLQQSKRRAVDTHVTEEIIKEAMVSIS